MPQIIETVEVSVPVRTAYKQWTQFESFPEFMEGVVRVTQVDDTTLDWVATVAGQRRERRARIIEREPDQRIALTSVDGAHNAGVVTFHRLDDATTRVTFQLDVEPDGPAGADLRCDGRRGTDREGRSRAVQGAHRVVRGRDRGMARSRRADDRSLTAARTGGRS